MPTIVSQDTLCELGRLIANACERGDSVTAIAERAGVNREFVSSLRNGTYRSSPTLDRMQAVCDAIGVRIELKQGK